MMDQHSTDFLTAEECAEVDRALLTSHDKFAARVTIYALRSLKQISQATGIKIEQLQPNQIEDWIYQDQRLQASFDREFTAFFSQLVIASRNPLKRTAADLTVEIQDLTVPQVVAWFENEAKQRLGKS